MTPQKPQSEQESPKSSESALSQQIGQKSEKKIEIEKVSDTSESYSDEGFDTISENIPNFKNEKSQNIQ